ncbi:MAG: nucleotidyltransferase family protein [Candidatus Bipolaricaulota bacterium]|nr:nucleotidyltransferase family protein [Candidatus Bipolaricaulota bacterium]
MIAATPVEAIVLAAGEGKRYGAIKPLVEIDGLPALARVVATLHRAGIERILIVLGYAAKKIEREVDLSSERVVLNPDYESGMGSSLALGIKSLAPETAGFLVLHADMPYLTAETVRAVLARAREGGLIVAPIYRGKRGFPVCLDRSCCEELLPTLVGETGAREYIASHPDNLVLVEVDDAGCVWDIDRPEDRMMREEEREPTVLKD